MRSKITEKLKIDPYIILFVLHLCMTRTCWHSLMNQDVLLSSTDKKKKNIVYVHINSRSSGQIFLF